MSVEDPTLCVGGRELLWPSYSQDGLVCNFKKKKAYYKAGWLDRTGGYCLVKESCTNLTISVVRASGVCVFEMNVD